MSSAQPDLATLQRSMLAALGGAAPDDGLMAAMQLPANAAADVLSVYRNSVHETLLNTLRLTYPICARLVGNDFFTAAAMIHLAATPSRHGDLDCYGAGFADFLVGYAPATELPYLPDAARLEWLVHRLRRAPSVPALDRAALAQLPSEAVADLQLKLVPRAALFESRWPVLRIWQAHQLNLEQPDFSTIDHSPDRALVVAADTIRIFELDTSRYHFFNSLQNGGSLDTAVSAALADSSEFDFAATMAIALDSAALERA
jgi:hypothetical protein